MRKRYKKKKDEDFTELKSYGTKRPFLFASWNSLYNPKSYQTARGVWMAKFMDGSVRGILVKSPFVHSV